MNTEQKMVRDFHYAMDEPVREIPSFPHPERTSLRLELIREEFEELKTACLDRKLVEVADGLGDLLYVIYGMGIEFGIDLESVFAEIHRSNMTKVGGTKRFDGKVLKPEGYERPNLTTVIHYQTHGR